MRSFRDAKRVRVTDKRSPFVGKVGTVVRLRRSDICAWVNMDDDLPPDLASFPEGDPRRNHVILHPEECEVAS